jgi:hypothetical protein
MRSKWEQLWDIVRKFPPTRCLRAALLVWVVYAGIIATIVAVNPSRRSATLEYQRATVNWWAGKPLYEGKNHYLYLPHYAVFYTPFELLPDRIGEPLWRLVCLSSLAWALWAAASMLAPAQKEAVFLVATVLVLPSTFASARNGQVNMPLAALFILIALALAGERWWTAAAMLALTLVFKPIAVAPILLCAAIFPKLRIPMLAALLVTAVVPLAHPNPSYALGEYGAFVAKLQSAGKPGGHSWCDFAGMLRVAGIHLPSGWQLAIRALAGVVTLGLCWRAAKCGDAVRAAFTVLLLSTIYLMLFNPRTETNSYVMLGAFVAVWCAVEGLVLSRLGLAAWLTALAVVLGSENYGWPVFPMTNLWAKALVTFALGVWLAWRIIRAPRGQPVLMNGAP